VGHDSCQPINYARTAAVTQTESVITCDRATGEPLLTTEVNIQASVEGRHAGTQTEADYIDGYTGLPLGMSLRAVARTVREMATASGRGRPGDSFCYWRLGLRLPGRRSRILLGGYTRKGGEWFRRARGYLLGLDRQELYHYRRRLSCCSRD